MVELVTTASVERTGAARLMAALQVSSSAECDVFFVEVRVLLRSGNAARSVLARQSQNLDLSRDRDSTLKVHNRASRHSDIRFRSALFPLRTASTMNHIISTDNRLIDEDQDCLILGSYSQPAHKT